MAREDHGTVTVPRTRARAGYRKVRLAPQTGPRIGTLPWSLEPGVEWRGGVAWPPPRGFARVMGGLARAGPRRGTARSTRYVPSSGRGTVTVPGRAG